MRNLIQTFQTISKDFLVMVVDYLLPPRCGLCSQKVMTAGNICGACFQQLSMISKPCCYSCSLPFDVPTPERSSCGQCLQTQPEYDRAFSAVVYGGAAKRLVLQLKHGQQYAASSVMIKQMVSVVLSSGLCLQCHETTFVVPVPLHWSRLAKRKFNQSALLAQGIAKALKYHYRPALLQRKKATQSQGGLGKEDRNKNVRGAFTVNKNWSFDSVANARVFLIDDVYTTGATVQECARELKKYGVKKVYVVTYARVVKGWMFSELSF
ncbi:ComF family protein [Temperatibacter marinus]|uniref:ComF family protein n=1 Tax=Temperatibacter marinus TaxID=1456591 RepID=A0AA52EF25_9PROT|nr:ComF family protein [Temperatibacter marinus]WND01369.1 ComF family protein [Temperatibacter marinus]